MPLASRLNAPAFRPRLAPRRGTSFSRRCVVFRAADEGPEFARNMRMEKAKALREELDGVRTRSRRLLAKGNRLIERGVQLKAAAERVMLGNEINKEDEARRLLVERKKVKDTLDLTTARAEVLAELASKLETAIIVLENATDEESVDAAKALAADTLPAAKRASLQEFKTAPVSSRPASMGEDDVSQDSIAERFGRDSLEREFAALEITQLERMLRLTPEDPPIPSEDAVVKEDDDDVVASNTEPAWWQPPSEPEDAAGATMTPRDALLEVDRARVSSKGVQGRHVVALRKSCAVHGAETIRGSDRLIGGKKDTAFRAGVGAALTAVETGEGETGWSSLGSYEPTVFLSDLARDLGVTPERAGVLVANATARKSAAALLQAGASVRGGEAESARVDLKKLTSVLQTFRACAGEYLDLVAFGLEQQLSEAERKIVLGLVPKETSEDVRGAIRCALGL